VAGHPNRRDRASLPVELWRVPLAPAVRSWVTGHAGSGIVRVRRLEGASSTAVHRIDTASGIRLVLRRYVWPGFLLNEPDAPRRECEVLRFAATRGLRVPSVVAADPDGSEVGDGIPALLMTFLPGRAVAQPDLHALAQVAAGIHAIDPADLGHAYFPWYADTTAGPPPASTRPDLWEQAIAVWHGAMPAYRPTLIHRDFHPGNVLWSRGRATGVVDWANGCAGPVGCDLAHCRANLRRLAGPDAAVAFLSAYEAVTGERFDPFWDLAALLEHDFNDLTQVELEQVEKELARSLAAAARASGT
jgi:Ser/Thr protein kinase RdoA (MazF antagonist)